jgi:hypothetical protein
MGSDNGGGHKTPFGPHGEGCQCDEHRLPTDEEIEEAMAEDEPEEPTVPEMFISIGTDRRDLNEMIFMAVSEAYASQLADICDQCKFVGEELTPRQIQAIVGGLMRGHAVARGSADAVKMNYMMLMMQARQEAEAKLAAEDAPEDEGEATTHGLRDVTDLFERPPDADPA